VSQTRATLDPDRLAALRRLAILDTPPEAEFDRLTDLAAELLSVPIALVTFVDDERQFFKCSVGLPEPWASQRETPLSHSFCQHVVDTAKPLILEDARDHPVLRENRAIPDLGVVAYAGIPLTTPSGYTLGTFCAIDTKPRRWTDREVELLQVFAAGAMTAIELYDQREQARVAAEALARSEADLAQVQKLDAVGSLAGGIAHDFNNILTAVLGYADLLLERELEPDVREDLEELRRAAERAAQLTRQLLAFARRQELAPERVNAGAVVEDLAAMLERLLGGQVELRLRLHDEEAEVEVDPGQLQQVITNLVLNARDALAESGAITIETDIVSLEEESVDAEVGPVSGRHVRVRVTDSGIGMSPEVRERVFEPFFTTKAVGEGTGLGLSTVLGIVRQSGGHLRLESEPGAGTTVDVLLPVAE
jgi:signal transduction histidine kinase